MEYRLELVILPVSDVDRAKAFYAHQVGFVVDHDHRVSDELRFVQLTPPGSACSIAIGEGITDATPGSVQGMPVVVDDADAVYDFLVDHGVDATPVVDLDWGRFTWFADPDGNRWAVQQSLPRQPAAPAMQSPNLRGLDDSHRLGRPRDRNHAGSGRRESNPRSQFGRLGLYH